MDTNQHSHRRASEPHHPPAGSAPVEGDGVFYRGLLWLGIVLVATVVFVQIAMYVLFRVLNYQVTSSDPKRPPLAAAPGQAPPAPNLLYELSGSATQNEPGYLRQYRAREDAALNGYTVDKAAGTAKIPIARAKELLLQKGLPSRPATGAK